MKPIDPVKKGPKGLVLILNKIIAALNGMKLVQGKGIYITPTDIGWIISTQPPDTSDGTTSAAAASDVNGGAWVTMITVDPSTCVQTTWKVWAKPG